MSTLPCSLRHPPPLPLPLLWALINSHTTGEGNACWQAFGLLFTCQNKRWERRTSQWEAAGGLLGTPFWRGSSRRHGGCQGRTRITLSSFVWLYVPRPGSSGLFRGEGGRSGGGGGEIEGGGWDKGRGGGVCSWLTLSLRLDDGCSECHWPDRWTRPCLVREVYAELKCI